MCLERGKRLERSPYASNQTQKSTPDMQFTSHLSALVVPRSRNQRPRERFRDSVDSRPPNRAFNSGQKAKPRINAPSTPKVAKLAPKIGSCRKSNFAKTLFLRTTRFTRQQCLMPRHLFSDSVSNRPGRMPNEQVSAKSKPLRGPFLGGIGK